MTLSQLEYLVAVDTHRHFGKAAENCFVSQPTLSIQLQKLEDELGVQLFDRSKTPVVPTDIGEQVIEQARQTLRESERIKLLVDHTHKEIKGTFRIGIIPTLAPYLVPMVVPVFIEKYPQVHLSIHELLTAQVLSGLRDETLDAGLIATDESSPDGLPAGITESKTLFQEPFMAYLSTNHRLIKHRFIDVKSLSLDDLWLLKEGHCFRDQILQVCGGDSQACGLHRSVQFESGNLETLQKVVDQAGGMTLLPYLATLYLDDDHVEQHVRPFTDPVPTRQVNLIYRRAHLKRHIIEAFTKAIFDELPPELGQKLF